MRTSSDAVNPAQQPTVVRKATDMTHDAQTAAPSNRPNGQAQDAGGTALLRHDARTKEALNAMFLWRWREIFEGDWEHDPDPGQVVVYGADPNDPEIQEEVAGRLKELRLNIAKRRARQYADDLETYVTLCEASSRPVRLVHGKAALGEETTWLITPEDAARFDTWSGIGVAAQRDPCYPMNWPAGELAHDLRKAMWLYDSGQRFGGMCGTLRATRELSSGRLTKYASLDYPVFRAWLERRALADALASIQAGMEEVSGTLRIAYVRSFVEEFERVYRWIMRDSDWKACARLTTQGDAIQRAAGEPPDAALFSEEPLRFPLANDTVDTAAPTPLAHVSAAEPEEDTM